MEKKEMLEIFLTDDNLDYLAVFQKINFDEYDFDNEMQNDKSMPIMLTNVSKSANDSVMGQNFEGKKLLYIMRILVV